MKNIQAFITNVSVPKTPEQLLYQMYERETYTIEFLFEGGEDHEFGNWTTPKWAKIGDIVFFMHAKTAGATLKSLRKQFIRDKDLYSPEEYDDALNFIEHGLELHKVYGGKVFAIARITGAPEYYDESQDSKYWKSNIYAEIRGVTLLEHLVDSSEFREFITISQSTITPVLGEKFDKLRELIISHGNNVPDYLTEANAAPFPMSAVNSSNWLELCYEWRNRFILEEQFRRFYVDYFLRELSDNKRLFAECRVRKINVTDSFVDNVIMFNGKYLPVEIKININSEADLFGQLGKYCYSDAMFTNNGTKNAFNHERIYHNNVLVMDTEDVYLYCDSTQELKPVCKLKSINEIQDIAEVRNEIVTLLSV